MESRRCGLRQIAVAKDEAHGLLTRQEVTTFISSLGIGEQFWCSQRLSGPPITFAYMDAQAAALAMSPVRQRWADDYFAIVKTHDEFDYLDRAEIALQVDSKENFDNNYSSNCCASNPGFEEDRTMSERADTPDSSKDEASGESDVLDDARAADLMREVIRVQERHREGGIEPELDNVGGDDEPDA
jgi:hypothetical protein